MTPREMHLKLAEDVELLCAMLLPAGQREGKHWCIGNLAGEAGKSLKVELTGHRRGLWIDHNGKEGGDLIDLWQSVKGLSFRETLNEIRSHLGLKKNYSQGQKKSYSRPPKQMHPLIEKETVAFDWLSEERCLSEKSLKAYQVSVDKNVIIFPYFRQGELIMEKFRQIRSKKIWATKNCEPCLFGWQVIPEEAREVVIAEGELDAMSYYEQGIPALSLPFGGGAGGKHQWLEYEYENLQRFDKIYLSLDMDETGQEALKEISLRLGRFRCFAVYLPFKDANEMLLHQKSLKPYLKQAKQIKPETLSPSTDYLNQVMRLFYPIETCPTSMMLPWKKAKAIVQFRNQEISLWTGINGHGKSMLLNQLALGGIGQGYKFCIASMEMKPERTLYRLFRQASACELPDKAYIEEINEWLAEMLYIFDVVGTAKQENIMECFRFARQCFGVTQFIVDSLAKCGINEDDYNAQKDFVDELGDFAKNYDCHIHLVVHSRKSQDESKAPRKMDVKGTGAITDMVDNVFAFWRNKRKEAIADHLQTNKDWGALKELQKEADAKLYCDKQRNGDWEGVLQFWYDQLSLQYLANPYEKPKPFINFSKEQECLPEDFLKIS